MSKVYRGYGKVEQLKRSTVPVDALISVQEKVDGSQCAACLLEDGIVGIQSRRQIVRPEKSGAFAMVVAYFESIRDHMDPDKIYYGECISKRKHNRIQYERIPKNGFVLFDVFSKAINSYLPYDEIVDIGNCLGLEVVPELYSGRFRDIPDYNDLLEHDSFLGGHKIEGFVVKDTKGNKCKVVSERFQEISKSHRIKVPKNIDLTYRDEVFGAYRTEARWHKAVQHLRDDGKLVDDMKDMPALMRELNQDLDEECAAIVGEELLAYFLEQENISVDEEVQAVMTGMTLDTAEEVRRIKANQLWLHFRKEFLRYVSDGMARWYRSQLIWQ